MVLGQSVFFGVGSAFDDERQEGTLVSIVASPMPLWKILVSKGLYMFCEMILITILTLFLFYIFEVKKGITIYVFFSFLFSGIYIFGFSILFSALVLIFRQLDSANYVIQYIFSILSGMTADVSKFPKIVRSISFSLPMTYLIIISRGISNRMNIQFLIKNIIIVTIITFFYSVLGLFLLKKAELLNRKNGSWEIW